MVNLTKVDALVNDLSNFADYLRVKLADFNSVTSLENSVDLSEGYGKTTQGHSGLIDIYDLTNNIKERFPNHQIRLTMVQKQLSNTIISKINGSANPNSHGLSIYMPIREGEFTEARKYALDGSKKIIDLQYNLIKSNHLPPFIHSTLVGDTIRGHINTNDVAKVTLWIYTTSAMPEGNTAIYQELDPSSFTRSDGSFEYKWNKQILSLCNSEKEKLKQSCKPVSMNIQVAIRTL